jgi:hypothetical protein
MDSFARGPGMGGAFEGAVMSLAIKPVVTQENDVWVIRLENTTGKIQEYRCATEAQARQLALVLTPKEKK